MNRCIEYCEDCEDIVKKHYFWYQGDTFQNALVVKDNEGKELGLDTVAKVEFRLLDGDKNIEYAQDYEWVADRNRWEITIPSSETATWNVDVHYYRYVATYTSGATKTLREALFTVEK